MRKYRTEWLASLLLGVITFVIHCHACANDFVNYDDDIYVTRNKEVLGGLTWPNLAWAWTSIDASNWHPLTWMSLQLDSALFAKPGPGHSRVIDPRGCHFTNALLHTANTVLLFWVLRLLTGFLGRSWIVAALFALHPLHVESVAWVSERKDVLSTLFWMLTLLAYYFYAQKPGWRRYLLVVLPFALGLAAKPMLVTLPFVMLLLDYWPLERLARVAGAESSKPRSVGESGASKTQPRLPSRQAPGTQYSVQRTPYKSSVRKWRPLFLEKVPLLALSAASSGVTLHAQHHGKAVASLSYLPLAARISNALTAYAAYIGKMFYPVDLALIYPHPGNYLPGMQVAMALAVVAAVSLLVIKLGSRFPYLPVGWLWYLGTLVPVIGLIQVGQQAMADRYTYIPLIGLFIMLAWGVADLAIWSRMEKVALPVTAMALLILGLLSWYQIEIWRDSVTLWSHTVNVTSNNAEARNQLGMALTEVGEIDEAIHQYQEALKMSPHSARTYRLWGVTLGKQRMPEEALKVLKKALSLDLEDPEIHFTIGVTYLNLGDLPNARVHFRECLRLDPNHARAKELINK